MSTINVHIIMLVICGSQFSGQDSIKHTLCIIVQAIFIVASFTNFNLMFLFNNEEAEELKVLMKNFKACLVAKFENNTAKYVYVVISNSY